MKFHMCNNIPSCVLVHKTFYRIIFSATNVLPSFRNSFDLNILSSSYFLRLFLPKICLCCRWQLVDRMKIKLSCPPKTSNICGQFMLCSFKKASYFHTLYINSASHENVIYLTLFESIVKWVFCLRVRRCPMQFSKIIWLMLVWLNFELRLF